MSGLLAANENSKNNRNQKNNDPARLQEDCRKALRRAMIAIVFRLVASHSHLALSKIRRREYLTNDVVWKRTNTKKAKKEKKIETLEEQNSGVFLGGCGAVGYYHVSYVHVHTIPRRL